MAAAKRKSGRGGEPETVHLAKVVPIRRGLGAPSREEAERAERDRRHAGWVEAIAAGDTRALEALYRDTVGRVYGLALRIVRVHEAAEEVAEDVFVQVWRTAGRWDAARGAPLAWILTIARSRALDYLRRDEPAIAHPEPEMLAEPATGDFAGDPLDLLTATEARGEIARALGRLSALQRQLVALAFFKGLSHQEIAVHAGLPLGTVKTYIRRSLAILREAMAPAARRDA